MKSAYGGIVINERETEPLSEYVIDFLFGLKKECAYLDYKWYLDLGKNSEEFIKTLKHLFAFANYGGGWILLGWKENDKKVAEPVGLPEDYNADQSVIQEKINSYLDSPLEIHFKLFNKNIDGKIKKFGIFFIPPSSKRIVPNKDGIINYTEDKKKIVFKKGDLFFRRGTSSIHPSPYEEKIIDERIKDENYRLSVLSGDADNIKETLYSNLFSVTKFPEWIYLGQKKSYDNVSIKVLLKQKGVFPEWIFKFRDYQKQMVIFENLEDPDNTYTSLVDQESIKKEKVSDWLKDKDKKRIIISLLNKEMIHFCFSKKLFYFSDKNKFFFPCIGSDERNENWISRNSRQSTRQVAKKSYASQLKSSVYHHHCFSGNFLELDESIFCYKIVPSFLLTHDGKNPLSSFKAGTFITRLAYNQFNDKYLNNILFWMYKISDGKSIKINDYLEISSNPLSVELNKGIISDLPSSILGSDI